MLTPAVPASAVVNSEVQAPAVPASAVVNSDVQAPAVVTTADTSFHAVCDSEATLPPRTASTAPDIFLRPPLRPSAARTAPMKHALRQVFPGAVQQLHQHALQSTSPGAAQQLQKPQQLQTLWLALLGAPHQLQQQRQRKQAHQQPSPGVEPQQPAEVQQPPSPPPLMSRAVHRTTRPRARHR